MIHTKFQDFVNESLSNLSKTRKWNMTPQGYSDMYFVYRLPKSKIGEYLNTWFVGEVRNSTRGSFKSNDEMITLKEVDQDTANHLYNRKYNPVVIRIMNAFQKDANLYQMKLVIRSVDDSSYGIWWNDTDLESLEATRVELMKHINTLPVVNGEQLLDYCVTLGADPTSKDYN